MSTFFYKKKTIILNYSIKVYNGIKRKFCNKYSTKKSANELLVL